MWRVAKAAIGQLSWRADMQAHNYSRRHSTTAWTQACTHPSMAPSLPSTPARPPRRTAPGCRSAGHHCAGPAPVARGMSCAGDGVRGGSKCIHVRLSRQTASPAPVFHPALSLDTTAAQAQPLYHTLLATHLLREGEDGLRVDDQAGGGVRRLPNLYEAVQAGAHNVAFPHLWGWQGRRAGACHGRRLKWQRGVAVPGGQPAGKALPASARLTIAPPWPAAGSKQETHCAATAPTHPQAPTVRSVMQGMSLPLCALSIVCRTVPVVRSHTCVTQGKDAVGGRESTCRSCCLSACCRC